MTTGPALQTLLAHLDGLSHGERIRHVVTLVRAADAGPGALALIDVLLAGDAYEAALAVEMAQAARDLHRLAAALEHRSFGVRRLAASWLVRLVPDAPAPSDSPERPVSPTILDVPALIHGLAPALRRGALKGLVRAGRRAAAAALFPAVLAHHGPREAAALLPALDPADLRRQLPALAHAAPPWRAILLRHPDVPVDHLRDRLAEAPLRDRPGVWSTHGGLVGALADLRPRALLDLLEAFPDTAPAWTILARAPDLLRADPDRLLAQLERPPVRDLLARQSLPKKLLNQVVRLDDAQTIRLARLVAEDPEHLAPLLRVVAPSRRAALLAAVTEGHGRDHRDWPDVLLDSLPHPVRRAEAARMLGLPAIQADPDRVLELTAHLPLAAAAPTLQRALKAADADERGRAIARLIACAARDTTREGALGEALALVAPRLRNDQDPVRLLAFRALAAVPAGAFRPADAELLKALVTAAAEARDTSYPTRSAIQQLAFKLLRAHAHAPGDVLFTAGLDLLDRLAGQTGTLVLPDLRQGLPQRTAPALVEALRPRIAAAAARERHELVFALATALGERAHGLTALTDLLEPLTTAKPDSVAQRAIGLLLADPKTRDERVRRLLAADRSAIALQPVLDHLHRRRQAWLDPYLDGSKIAGRFLTGKTTYLLPVHGDFHRWLPRQQHAFARLIERAGHDKGHAHFTRAHVIARLALLPVTTIADFEPFLRSEEVPVIEAALAALAWTDTPAAALPVLLEHLDGDRARVAMYAIPRVARFLPPSELAATLAALLTGKPRKLTVRKEALRLLGVHRSPRSLPILFEILAQPDLHKDLAIAVGHAARSLLDDPRAHGLLATLACSPEPDIARSLLDPRPDHLPLHARSAYARLVLAVARHPDLTARRAATRVLPLWSTGQESEVAEHLAAVVLDLAHGTTWEEAAAALVLVSSEHSDHFGPLARVVGGLAALADQPLDAAASSLRDLPARQRLRFVHAGLLALDRTRRLSLQTGFAALAGRLVADDLWPLAAALRLSALDLADPAATDVLRDLAADARADAFLGDLVAHLERNVAAATSVAPADLLARAHTLAAAAPPAARLAVAILATTGERTDWPADLTAALVALRSHPDLRVRTAARDVFTRPEAAPPE